MKLKGKTAYHKALGTELGEITKATKTKVWIGRKKYDRQLITVVKKSKRARKGKAPSPETQDKRDRRHDHEIDLPPIPKNFRRELEDPLTETNIQLRSYGCKASSKMWHTSTRVFADVDKAKKYLEKFIRGELLYYPNDQCRYAKLKTSGRGIVTNYSIPQVLKGKPPKGKLVNIIHDDDRKVRPVISSTTTTKSTRSAEMATKKTTKSSDTVCLKDVCRELDLDPRKARIKLRKTVGNTDGRWAWEKGSKELQKVKDILSGTDTKEKPAKKTKKKATTKKKRTKK